MKSLRVMGQPEDYMVIDEEIFEDAPPSQANRRDTASSSHNNYLEMKTINLLPVFLQA